FALEHPDGYRSLAVLRGREDLTLLGRDGRVAIDQTGKHATQRLDPEAQRSYVEQHNIFDVTQKNARLNGSTQSNHLVRVHTLMWFLAKEFGHFLNDLGHTGHTTDQHNLVNVRSRQARILERRLAWFDRRLDQITDQRFELGTSQFHDHMQRRTV